MTQREPWWRGKRGEWYVVIQALLFALIVFGPRTLAGHPPWPAAWIPASEIAGAVLLAAGVSLGFFGLSSLGRNLTPLPHPKEDAVLVETGAYRLARHPIYGGLILMAFGFALLVGSFLTVGYATLLFIFFDIKSRREERWLNRKFPGYRAYSRRVRRLIPFIY